MDKVKLLKLVNDKKNLNDIKNELQCSTEELCNNLISYFFVDDYLIIDKLSVFGARKKQILFDISFQLKPNSFHVFIGENGAGKSTTIKTIIGKIDEYNGSIFFNDSQTLDRSKIFYVPDQQPQFPNISVFKYLFELTSLLIDINKDILTQKIDFLLNKYSLENRRNHNLNKLSTGQKQKVMIISALLVNSNYIILDEPFANLDPTSRYAFMADLKQLSQEGKCIFLSTHIIEEIKEYATHVTFIKKGKIIQDIDVNDPKYISEYYLNNYLGEF